jgi:hypothetical protein
MVKIENWKIQMWIMWEWERRWTQPGQLDTWPMIWNALIGARLFSGGTDTCVVLCWPRGIHKSRGETQSCNSWNWMGGSCHCKDYRHQQGWHPRYFAEELLCPSAKKSKKITGSVVRRPDSVDSWSLTFSSKKVLTRLTSKECLMLT